MSCSGKREDEDENEYEDEHEDEDENGVKGHNGQQMMDKIKD